MIRFEIERALIKREVKASDIPGMWNEKFREYFGIDVPSDDVGCLQDIHWAEGMIGYFPTYTLGNLNAAQLYRKAGEEIDNLEAKIAAGDYAPLREWLTAKVHSQGKRYSSADLIKEATGQPLQSVAMMEYLKSKYSGLYGF